jgi:DNA repair protein RadC
MNHDEYTYPEMRGSAAVREAAENRPGIPSPRLLPETDRPRERLCREGAAALSDQELLAILLNTGIRGKNVTVLAGEVLDRLDRSKGMPSVKDLVQIPGLGESKAAAIAATLELGRRIWGVAETRVRQPSDIYALVRHYADRKQERFICISLNGAHEVLAVRVVSLGLVNRTIVHPREVFADPILDRCTGVCVCHNHPSGKVTPSREDDSVTHTLEKAAAVLGIRFMDHIIFSETAYFSYREAKRLREDL